MSEAQTPPTGMTPQTRMMILAGIVSGALLIIVLPVAGLGLAWILSREAPKTEGPAKLVEQKESPKPSLVVEKPKPPAAPEPPPMPPKIKEALDKGAAHLRSKLLEKKGPFSVDSRYRDDAAVGGAALAGLALLEARIPPADPAIQEALAMVRQGAPRLSLVYALGSALFFLNRLDDVQALTLQDRDMARTLAFRILAGQHADGRWSYQNPPITPETQKDLEERLRSGAYKPKNARPTSMASNSMTQFALLALWGSRRYDVPIRPAIFISSDRFHKTQHPEGTWDYRGVIGGKTGKIRCDSNTCAGLIALAMEKTMRQDKKFHDVGIIDPPAHLNTEELVAKAFAHLTKVIGRTKEKAPGNATVGTGAIIKADAWGDYYFLWCLERVSVIYDKSTIGGKDWYAWGSELILENQRPDGSWLDRHGNVPDTCFAMLFLCRTNLAKDLTESIRTHGGAPMTP